MKKVILCAAVLALAANLFALRPGDAAEELTGVKWMQGIPFAMLPPAKPQEGAPRYRAVVFLLTRGQTADDTLSLLNYLRRTFANKVRFAAVTPDSETDVKALLARRPDFELSFGVDTTRKVTPQYLGSSRMLPMAFLTDDSGKILWSGEVVPCCRDAQGEMVMGNIFQEDISRIWNGPRYRSFRKKLLKQPAEIGICHLCSGYGFPNLS